MTRTSLMLPIAAVLALSLSACGRDPDRTTQATNPELPSLAQAPVNADRPAAGTMLNPDTSDPSIPRDPATVLRNPSWDMGNGLCVSCLILLILSIASLKYQRLHSATRGRNYRNCAGARGSYLDRSRWRPR